MRARGLTFPGLTAFIIDKFAVVIPEFLMRVEGKIYSPRNITPDAVVPRFFLWDEWALDGTYLGFDRIFFT